jgi:hypothetical protein
MDGDECQDAVKYGGAFSEERQRWRGGSLDER